MPLPNWVNWGILFDQFFTSKVQPKPIRGATVLHLQAMELVTSFHPQDGIRELGGRDVCYVYFCILTCYNDFPDFRWVGYSRHPIPYSPFLWLFQLLRYQCTLCWSKVAWSCCCSSLYPDVQGWWSGMAAVHQAQLNSELDACLKFRCEYVGSSYDSHGGYICKRDR